ncbi:ras-related protein Rab-43-like [Glandiceps talaboti]
MSSYCDFGMGEPTDFSFKVIIVGDATVGKSSVVQRFESGRFERQQSTIGVDFIVKTLSIDDKKVKLQVWDTAGQERYRTITQSYYNNANGVVVAYDITKRKTFDNLPEWIDDVKKYAGEHIVLMLIGNKSDLPDREVDFRDAEALARYHDMCACLETSAKKSTNVMEAFVKMATELKKRHEQGSLSHSGKGTVRVSANSGGDTRSQGCCK